MLVQSPLVTHGLSYDIHNALQDWGTLKSENARVVIYPPHEIEELKCTIRLMHRMQSWCNLGEGCF